MLSSLYAKWMYAWETALTTRDTNRVVRPLEWGFDWLKDFNDPCAARVDTLGTPERMDCSQGVARSHSVTQCLDRMIALNEEIVRRSEDFFGYETPLDFRIERRHPE